MRRALLVLAVLLCLVKIAVAAPTFDAATPHIPAGTSVSFTHVVANQANRVLYLGVGLDANSGSNVTNTPTCDGSNMTELTGSPLANADSTIRLRVYRFVAPAVGTVTIAFTVNTVGWNVMAMAVSMYGVDQTTPDDTIATSTGTTGTAVSASVTSASGELVLDFVTANRNLTVDASQTARINDNSNTIRGGASTEAGAATVSMDWTKASNGLHAHIGFSINAAAGGGPPAPTRKKTVIIQYE